MPPPRDVLWEICGAALKSALSTGEAVSDASQLAQRVRPKNPSEVQVALETAANVERMARAFAKVK